MADKNTPPVKTSWDFVEEHFPGYHKSPLIAKSNDLHKLVNDDYEEGDSAAKLLEKEYGNDVNNPLITIDHNETLVAIYELAIENFYKKSVTQK